MSLENVLAWLTGADAGAFLVVTWLASWGLEEFAFWQKLSSKARQLIILLLAAALGAGAQWLADNPATVAALQPYVQPAIYAAIAWLGSQVAHRLNTARGKPDGRG